MGANVPNVVDIPYPRSEQIRPWKSELPRQFLLVGNLHPTEKDGQHPEVPKLDGNPDGRMLRTILPLEVLDELILRAAEGAVETSEPLHIFVLSRDTVWLLRETGMYLARIAMGPWISRAEEESDLDSQCDLNSFDGIEKEEAQSFVEDVKIHDLLEGRTGQKFILNDDWLLPGQRVKQRQACDGVNAEMALSKWVPISAQPVVSDSLKTAVRSGQIGNLHATLREEYKLIGNAPIGLCIVRRADRNGSHK